MCFSLYAPARLPRYIYGTVSMARDTNGFWFDTFLPDLLLHVALMVKRGYSSPPL